MDAIDCQGFAGGFTLGTVQAGFRLVGKREHTGAFGAPACEANRHLLGHDWVTEAGTIDDWTPYQVPYVFGNPPCSGFSLMSDKAFRGMDSRINSCMWDFAEYAARCRPDIIVMESVGQAFTTGQPLMQALRAHVETRTGDQYDLTHVMQDCLSLGGCAVRRRYFLVMHKVPFGVEHAPITTVPTLEEAIGDLESLDIQWEPQHYQQPPSWWSEHLRSPDGMVDGMAIVESPGNTRTQEMLDSGVEWKQGENMQTAVARYFALNGTLPESWMHLPSSQKHTARLAEQGDCDFGFNQPLRWKYNQPARVVHGGFLGQGVHPRLNRLMTHREALRILGFPDNWHASPVAHIGAAQAYWGKGVTVTVGRWISSWVRLSLEGTPGTVTGELIGDRERLIDVSKDWRKHVNNSRERIPLRLVNA
jgi:site-specific DNA-cytosine methylase